MSAASTAVASGVAAAPAKRWVQLIFGIVCMVMIANLQYGWTLFVNPIDQKHHGWRLAAIQFAFSIFIATETWLVPIEGWFVDRFGPRIVGRLIGWRRPGRASRWVINSDGRLRCAMLYVGAAISGIGAGAVYGTCVGNAVKWFPDRRGLAAGLTAAGFGAGAALTVIPIRYVIARLRLRHRLPLVRPRAGRRSFVLLSRFLRGPEPGETPQPAPRADAVAAQTSRRTKCCARRCSGCSM